MTTRFQPNAILLAMLGALVSAGALAEDRVMFTTGDVQIRDAGGQLRAAVKGMEIRPGDTIVTTAGGYVQAKMQTGFMAVRPETQVKLDSLPATLSPGAGVSSQVTLLQGAVRMIAAEQGGAGLGKVAAPAPATMVVQTPNANISLKNSDGEVRIALPKSAGAVPTTVSLVNSGTALVKGDIGVAVPVAANMAAAVTGSALPNVTSIAAAPMLTAMVQKPPLVTLQPSTATLPATEAIGGKSLLPAAIQPIVASAPPKPIVQVMSLPDLRLPSVLQDVTAINKPIGQQVQIATLPKAVESISPAVNVQTMVNQNTVMDAINTVTTVVKLNNTISTAQATSNTIINDSAVVAANLNLSSVANTNTAITSLGGNLVLGVVNKQVNETTVNNNLGALSGTAITAATTASTLATENPALAPQMNTLATKQAEISSASSSLANTMPSMTSKTTKFGISLR